MCAYVDSKLLHIVLYCSEGCCHLNENDCFKLEKLMLAFQIQNSNLAEGIKSNTKILVLNCENSKVESEFKSMLM